jgi:transposase InsO family protein
MVDGGDHTLDQHALDALVRRRGYDDKVLAVLLRARERILLAVGLAIARLREAGDPLRTLEARIRELLVRIVMLEQENTRLRSRLERIEARRRSHYTPSERFQILAFMKTWLLSAEQTAQRFLVSPRTISRWLKEATREPAKQTIGCLVKAVPPLRAYCHVVRDLVATMEALDFGGSKRIAQTLARSAIKVGTETVRRWRKRRHRLLPTPAAGGRSVVARYPNHVWMADLTEIPGFLRIFSCVLGGILDVRSRMPLAARLYPKQPTAEDLVALLDAAIERHGPPRHFVSDHGAQFTGEAFRAHIRSLDIRQRFGAVGQYGSIAIVERLWKTVKELLHVRRWSIVHPADMQHRLDAVLTYYAYMKPHQGLAGSAPAEVYFGICPAHLGAHRPPREGSCEPAPAFDIAFLDPEGRLPFLVPRAA